MSDVEESVEIAAPPNEVFVFFMPQRMPHWYGTEIASEFEAGGEPEFRVAQKVRISGRLKKIVPGKEIAHTAVVTQYEFPRVLEWQFQDAYGVRGIERWTLGPSAAGTRVTMRSEYSVPGRAARLLDRLFTRRALARRNREYLVRLRRLAERR